MTDGKGIPAWQRATPSAPPAPAEQEPVSEQQPEADAAPAPAAEAEESTDSRWQSEDTTLLEQASRFLDDPAIRDAPREKKVAFLESKGVKADEIEQLLEAPQQEITTEVGLSQAGERAWSKAPSQAPAPRPHPRDTPPIVTYPEFLVQSEKPPPLVTTKRLINTAYITGGLIATMYGLSKYIIAPMAQNLVESRHDFASHAKVQLDEFNNRLKDVVSSDPATKLKAGASDIMDDISEAESDPTELFHRDFGTQTTPSLSRRPSVASSPDTESSVVASHESRLKILTSHLKELESTRSNDASSTDSLKTKISDLSTYLAEMSYQSHYGSGMGSFYYPSSRTTGGNLAKSNDDQIETFKGDIRAVKGVLLSARNFPAGGSWSNGRVGA